jgi:hypothetical protein
MRLPALLVPKRAALIVHKHALVSSVLMFLGAGGALAGGALIGEWALGLVLIAESGLAFWFGLYRDDGELSRVHVRGLLTHEQVLARERARPWDRP